MVPLLISRLYFMSIKLIAYERNNKALYVFFYAQNDKYFKMINTSAKKTIKSVVSLKALIYFILRSIS